MRKILIYLIIQNYTKFETNLFDGVIPIVAKITYGDNPIRDIAFMYKY